MPETHGPDPDPDKAIARAVAAERDYANGLFAVLAERIAAMDKATTVLAETVGRVPTELQREIGHLRELMNERQATVEEALRAIRDTISKQDATQQRALVLAVEKSDDVRSRVARLEDRHVGSTEQRHETRTVTAGVYAAIGLAVTLVLAALAVVTALTAG